MCPVHLLPPFTTTCRQRGAALERLAAGKSYVVAVTSYRSALWALLDTCCTYRELKRVQHACH